MVFTFNINWAVIKKVRPERYPIKSLLQLCKRPEVTSHEQHNYIRAASCRSRLESQWETKLGCLTKRVKFHICNPSGIVLAIWWKYTAWGFLIIICYRLSSPRAQVTRRAEPPRDGVPRHVLPCKEVRFGGAVDTLPSWGILWAKTPNFWDPR